MPYTTGPMLQQIGQKKIAMTKVMPQTRQTAFRQSQTVGQMDYRLTDCLSEKRHKRNYNHKNYLRM